MAENTGLTLLQKAELAKDLEVLAKKFGISEQILTLEIGKLLGSTSQAKKHYYKPRNAGKKWTVEDEKLLIKSYQIGGTSEQIATTLGRTRTGIISHLADYCNVNNTDLALLNIKLSAEDALVFDAYFQKKTT